MGTSSVSAADKALERRGEESGVEWREGRVEWSGVEWGGSSSSKQQQQQHRRRLRENLMMEVLSLAQPLFLSSTSTMTSDHPNGASYR